MNIGFFGDSYVAFDHQDTWGRLLINELDMPTVLTGKGGSNQYHAIDQWLKLPHKPALAVFTFTWHHRLYHSDFYWDEVCRAEAEARPLDAENLLPMAQAVKIYRENLYNDEYTQFCYDLMVRWILDLPRHYADTKFIFLPNTEYSRTLALQHFSRGVLFDFAFETISDNEPLSPGPVGQVHDMRPGHMNRHNNAVFKNIIKSVILDYPQYQDKVLEIDYRLFDSK